MTINGNTISVYEHSSISVSEKKLTEREQGCLKRLHRLLGDTYFKFDETGRRIYFTNYVGVIGIGRRTIEILPKIDDTKGDDSEENKYLCRNRLLDMLAIAGDISYKFSTEASLSSKNIPLLEFFIRLYVNETCELLKRGLVHNYKKHEDETNFLRGKLNVAEQVRLTARRIPRFSVKYHEFSSDVLINRIIKDVSRMLQSITQDYKNQRELLLIDAILEDVSFKRHTSKDVDKIIRDRKTYGYEMLLALCKLFLQDRIPDFSAGETPIIPILFDMNKLFERFIGQMLRRMVLQGELSSFREVQLGKGGRCLLYKLNGEKIEKIKELIPDIQLMNTSNRDENNGDVDPSIIIDTKWKKLDIQNKQRSGINDDDLYQMFAYTIKYRPKRTILLYPKTIDLKNGDEPLETFFVEQNSTLEGKIEAWTINLTSDLSNTNKNTFYRSIKDQLGKIIIGTKNGNSKEQ